MELHMVHQLTSREYLVVGRWIEIGAFNSALDSIFSDLPPNGGDIFDLPSFDLNSLLPGDLRSYRYTGSLTTSPYTEGVNWVMLHESLQLSADQVAGFRALFPGGNEREWQNLNGRMIRTDVAGFSSVPEPSTAALLGLGVLLIVGQAKRLASSRRRKV